MQHTQPPAAAAAAAAQTTISARKRVALSSDASLSSSSSRGAATQAAAAWRARDIDVLVLGSCNVDITIRTPAIPAPAETVMAGASQIGYGGKGANQAVAAALLGASSCIVGCVGDDAFGRATLDNFRARGVDASGVRVHSGTSTGIAPILILPSGQNAIVVSPGANMDVGDRELMHVSAMAARTKVVIVQNEVPLAVSIEALRRAKLAGAVTIFNPAPAPTPAELLALGSLTFVDYIVPNEVEAEALTGIRVESESSAALAVAELHARFKCRSAIITMGERGAYFGEPHTARQIMVLAEHVDNVVDTSGAGDCFVGAFAAFLARDAAGAADVDQHIANACVAATYSVQRAGTQTSYPTLRQISAVAPPPPQSAPAPAPPARQPQALEAPLLE